MGQMGGDKRGFVASVFERGSDGAINRAGRPQMRVTVSRSEFFYMGL